MHSAGSATFAGYRKPESEGRGVICPRCRKEPTRGSVGIHMKERLTGKKAGDKTLDSASKALCEKCAVQVYREISAMFLEMTRNP